MKYLKIFNEKKCLNLNLPLIYNTYRIESYKHVNVNVGLYYLYYKRNSKVISLSCLNKKNKYVFPRDYLICLKKNESATIFTLIAFSTFINFFSIFFVRKVYRASEYEIKNGSLKIP